MAPTYEDLASRLVPAAVVDCLAAIVGLFDATVAEVEDWVAAAVADDGLLEICEVALGNGLLDIWVVAAPDDGLLDMCRVAPVAASLLENC